MENSVASPRRTLFRLGTATAIGLGIVLGSVLRDLPIAVASLLFRTDRVRPCDGEASECVVAAVPDIIGGLVVFGFLVVVIAYVCAAGGAVLVAHGRRRSNADGIDARGVVRERSAAGPAVGFVQIVVGTTLVVPAVWLFASFVQSL
jgi:hypothetical protein